MDADFVIAFELVAVNVYVLELATVGVPVSHQRVGNITEFDASANPAGSPDAVKLLIPLVLGK
jgi:hypothetical protein